MEIVSLTKEVNLNQKKVLLSLDVELDCNDFVHFDYEGFDLVDDEMIPDILLAISRMYARSIKNGKILREKVNSII